MGSSGSKFFQLAGISSSGIVNSSLFSENFVKHLIKAGGLTRLIDFLPLAQIRIFLWDWNSFKGFIDNIWSRFVDGGC
jgi:hypothetical protein